MRKKTFNREIKMDVLTIHGPFNDCKRTTFPNWKHEEKECITLLIVSSQQCLKMKKCSIKQCQKDPKTGQHVLLPIQIFWLKNKDNKTSK